MTTHEFEPRRVFDIPRNQDDFDTDNLLISLEKLKSEITLFVDFKCDFDERGLCKLYRKNNPDKAAMCCCNQCRDMSGYIDWVNLRDLKEIRKLWSKRTGFWRKGKGCILPRAYRSATCTFYHCHTYSSDENMSRVDEKRLDTLRDIHCTLEDILRERVKRLKYDVTESFEA